MKRGSSRSKPFPYPPNLHLSLAFPEPSIFSSPTQKPSPMNPATWESERKERRLVVLKVARDEAAKAPGRNCNSTKTLQPLFEPCREREREWEGVTTAAVASSRASNGRSPKCVGPHGHSSDGGRRRRVQTTCQPKTQNPSSDPMLIRPINQLISSFSLEFRWVDFNSLISINF